MFCVCRSCKFSSYTCWTLWFFGIIFETLWLSGLRRWLQAPVRKGVCSNPTGVNFVSAWIIAMCCMFNTFHDPQIQIITQACVSIRVCFYRIPCCESVEVGGFENTVVSVGWCGICISSFRRGGARSVTHVEIRWLSLRDTYYLFVEIRITCSHKAPWPNG